MTNILKCEPNCTCSLKNSIWSCQFKSEVLSWYGRTMDSGMYQLAQLGLCDEDEYWDVEFSKQDDAVIAWIRNVPGWDWDAEISRVTIRNIHSEESEP